MPEAPDDHEEAEPQSVLERFETPNPWLQKLFAMPNYGTVPAVAIGLLREVSPDSHEKLLAALKTNHGRINRGYLLATTKWLRWVRTFPTRADDQWGYEYKPDYKGIGLTKAVIILGSGDQFQTYRTRGKPFVQMVTVIQQAMMWAADHEEEMVVDALTTSAAPVHSLAEEIQKLAAMHEQGILTAEEFAAAKQKLMS